MEDDGVLVAPESTSIIYLNKKRKYGAQQLGILLVKRNVIPCDHEPEPTELSSDPKRCRTSTTFSGDDDDDDDASVVTEETCLASHSSVIFQDGTPSATVSKGEQALSVCEELEFLSNHEDDPRGGFDLLCVESATLNGVDPLKNGATFCRCENSGGAKQGLKKATIDKEFEEYFSMLML